jgi:4-azaleucine resistance transporter AzlC
LPSSKNWPALRAAFPHTIPVFAGFLFLGIAFGILLHSSGYGVFWAFLMSLIVYAGSMQFVAIGLIAAGFLPVQAIIMTIMVNARHIFYGLSMLDKFANAGKFRPYLIFALTDETYSLLCTAQPPPNVESTRFYFMISLLNHCYWVLGAVLGSLGGAVLPFSYQGIEFVMTALFVVIFLEQWLKQKDHRPALIGVGFSLICLLIFGAEWFIIPSMAVIVIGLMAIRRSFEARAAGAAAKDGDASC